MLANVVDRSRGILLTEAGLGLPAVVLLVHTMPPEPLPIGNSRPFSRVEIRAMLRAARAPRGRKPHARGSLDTPRIRSNAADGARGFGADRLHHRGDRHGLPAEQAGRRTAGASGESGKPTPASYCRSTSRRCSPVSS